MKIKNKIFLISLFLLFGAKGLEASFLWNIYDGVSYFQKNDFNNAINEFKTFEKYNPNDKNTYFWLAKTYLKTPKQEALAQKNLKKFYELYSQEKNTEKISYEPINNQQIEDYFDMAIMYFEEGNFFEANYYADMILKINPKSSSAYFIKAKLAQLEKKEDIAKTFLNKAIALNNDILRTNLAKSLNIYALPELTKEIYLTFAQEAFFYLDMSNAIKNAKKYIELDKTNSNVYSLLIEAYLAQGNIQGAKEVLFEAQKLFSNNLQLKLLEAQIANIENDTEKRANALEQAYKINPNNKQVLYELSNLYIQKQDFKKANEISRTLVIVDDLMYEAYFNLIYSSIKIADIDFAVSNIRKLSELNENKSELNYLLSLICQYQGDFKNSKGYLLQALKEDENAQYYLDLAKIEYLEKNYSLCEKYLLEGLKVAKNSTVRNEIEDYLIKSYLKNNNFKLAQNYLFKKTALDKNRIIYKYNLYILNKMRDNSRAQKELKQIVKIKPLFEMDYLDLSEIYFDENKPQEAIKLLDKALKKKNNSEFYLQKIKIYFVLNQEENIKNTIIEMKNNLNSPQG
ncbi:MAG: tetratricopeptide repeat protein [Candidatus Gastranaerophilales bacterium]|nr:tetratricopeptide repeat protein [Candidatus Gastranaerophilales bacterium]